MKIFSPISKSIQIAIFQDEKTSGTDGGGSTAGAFNVRTLNTTVVNNISGASLASDTITLPAGTYRVKARSPVFIVGKHQLRLRNTTDATTTIVGISGYTDSTDAVQVDGTLMGRFTITATKDFQLQHYTELTRATNGLGSDSTSGEVEVYAVIEIIKD